MDDEELLYTDLFEHLEDGKSVIKTTFHELEERIEQLTEEGNQLRAQVENLQSQNQKLQKQNEVLVRNISCLFKTAQMEIARKDKRIKCLQEEQNRGENIRHSPANPRQSTPAAPSRTGDGKSNVPATVHQTDSKEDSSVCNGNFRKRVRSEDDWRSIEDNCTPKNVEEERNRSKAEARKWEEKEIHGTRHASQSRGSDVFRERRKEKWDRAGKAQSNRKETSSLDERGMIRGEPKLAIDSKTPGRAERRSDHRRRANES